MAYSSVDTPGEPDDAQTYQFDEAPRVLMAVEEAKVMPMGQILLANVGERAMRLMQNTFILLALQVLAVFMTAQVYHKSQSFCFNYYCGWAVVQH